MQGLRGLNFGTMTVMMNDVGRASDIYAGGSGSYPSHLYATTKKLYFGASTSSGGNEPYFVTSGDPFPSIASVTSTTSNGSYKTGSTINITDMLPDKSHW